MHQQHQIGLVLTLARDANVQLLLGNVRMPITREKTDLKVRDALSNTRVRISSFLCSYFSNDCCRIRYYIITLFFYIWHDDAAIVLSFTLRYSP